MMACVLKHFRVRTYTAAAGRSSAIGARLVTIGAITPFPPLRRAGPRRARPACLPATWQDVCSLTKLAGARKGVGSFWREWRVVQPRRIGA